jgi:hypothetical protein
MFVFVIDQTGGSALLKQCNPRSRKADTSFTLTTSHTD